LFVAVVVGQTEQQSSESAELLKITSHTACLCSFSLFQKQSAAFMWERADELGFPVQSTSSTNGIPMLLTEEEEKKAALAGAGGGSLSLNGT
jgi:hypothetical protein